MAKEKSSLSMDWNDPNLPLRGLGVRGFKSIGSFQQLDIRPLTVLAGANSSGKSAIMQALLLLKQTLEAPFDPGSLLLNGPILDFTSADQLLSDLPGQKPKKTFSVRLVFAPSSYLGLEFKRGDRGFTTIRQKHSVDGSVETVRPGMPAKELVELAPEEFRKGLGKMLGTSSGAETWGVASERCFLRLALWGRTLPSHVLDGPCLMQGDNAARRLIYLPGLRGGPERNYPVTAVEATFPGAFQNYTASVIAQWQDESQTATLSQVGEYLKLLGLTWKVKARPVNDAQVELLVGRLPKPTRGGAHDLVNIADVGLGVSQILPVVVALTVAEPGQVVYLEQPEIHLHPRAQHLLAQVLADAAKRGVITVVETHSKLLLLGIQSLVAKTELNPDLVSLNWFQRDAVGATKVTAAELDGCGRFGDWPEDFDDVSLEAESEYLDTIDLRSSAK